MRNLDVHVTVPPDRKVVVQLPDDVELGEADLTVIVRRKPRPAQAQAELDWFPTLNVSHWDPNTSLRREDLYGDDGR